MIRKGKESLPATVSVPDNLITSSSESGSSGETKTGENESSSVSAAASSGNTSSAVNREKAIAEALRLYKKNPQENEPFKVTDMFPGDKETKYFRVRVSHNGTVTVRYHADVRQDSEKLAEVLKVKITLLTTGEEMYDGLMRDMPKSLSHTLNSNGDAEDELYYEITAYLETDTGNEYQNKQQKSIAFKRFCTCFKRCNAHRHHLCVVHRHRKHRYQQDSGRQSGCKAYVQHRYGNLERGNKHNSIV